MDEAEVRTDWVLLTHNHSDHTCIESLLRIRDAWPKARFAGPVESVQAMVEAGIPQERTITVRAGDRLELDGLQVAAVYAKPPEGDPEQGIAPPDVTHLGYVIDAGGVRVYVSGDPINTFAERDDLIRPIAELQTSHRLFDDSPDGRRVPVFRRLRGYGHQDRARHGRARSLRLLCQAQLRSSRMVGSVPQRPAGAAHHPAQQHRGLHAA